jgi:hypothetical protein
MTMLLCFHQDVQGIRSTSFLKTTTTTEPMSIITRINTFPYQQGTLLLFGNSFIKTQTQKPVLLHNL